jgi:hypothetical protein
VAYIGGGRFGVLHAEHNPGSPTPSYTIKKIIVWEKKEDPRGEWRRIVADHYSNI